LTARGSALIVALWACLGAGLSAQQPITGAQGPIVSSSGAASTITSGSCGSTVGVQSISSAGVVTCWDGTTFTPQVLRIGIGVAAGSTAKVTLLGGSIVAPSADSTAAIHFTKSDAATDVMALDSTNRSVILRDSTAAAPSIYGSNTAYGCGPSATISWKCSINSAEKVQISVLNSGSTQPGVNLTSDGAVGWWSGTGFQSGSVDLAMQRNAANILELNTGTSGTFADLKLRTIIHPTTTAVAVANVGANSCGTTAATIAGNENVGAFTVGATSGTQCRITFTTTAPNRRHCVFADETTTIAIRSTYVDTTHTDAIGAFVAGDVVSYVCAAR
jgi:hypothetical protein